MATKKGLGVVSEEEDRATIANLIQQVNDLQYELAITKQRIAKLEGLTNYRLRSEGAGRRDFTQLAYELVHAIGGRISARKNHKLAGMTYKEVQLWARFKHPTEAYRLMDEAVRNFPDRVTIVMVGKQKKLVPTHVYADEIKSYGEVVLKRL